MIWTMQGDLWEDVRSVVEPQVNAEGVHLWPFDRSFPVDVRFFSFGKLNHPRMRRHDYFEILYMHSGRMDCQIHSRHMKLNPGDLLVVNSMLYHFTNPERPNPKARAVALYFEPDVIATAESDGSGPEYLLPFLFQGPEFPHIIPASSPLPREIFRYMQRIHQELPTSSRQSQLTVKTYLRVILVLLVNHFSSWKGSSESLGRRQRLIERLKPLFAHIERHYSEEISLCEAAALAGMSKPHFMSMFKNATGSSFKHYINSFRIAKAQQLLAATDKPISEVAVEVGFCDQSYFGLLFRRHVHMTPLQYRMRFVRDTRTPGSGYAP